MKESSWRGLSNQQKTKEIHKACNQTWTNQDSLAYPARVACVIIHPFIDRQAELIVAFVFVEDIL